MKKHVANHYILGQVLLVILCFLFPLSHPNTVHAQNNQEILPISGQKQLQLGELDNLGRATYAHIQLKDDQSPTSKRAKRLTYNPAGWHNYKFYYGNGDKKTWLMDRGHLIAYQFSGLNDEGRNLTPITHYLNTGKIKGTDSSNPEGMLFYEEGLDNWLSLHPNYYLDYVVTPLYEGTELIPRQIKLQYMGLDENGSAIQILLNSPKEIQNSDWSTTVVLDNISPNAEIDYQTGQATNTMSVSDANYSTQTVQTTATEVTTVSTTVISEISEASTEDRTVYVTQDGKNDVYWYSYDELLKYRPNIKKIKPMPESVALRQGKHHSMKE